MYILNGQFVGEPSELVGRDVFAEYLGEVEAFTTVE